MIVLNLVSVSNLADNATVDYAAKLHWTILSDPVYILGASFSSNFLSRSITNQRILRA